ncbi:DUF3325 domain-containing protein [Sphingomonas aracearum]|uniref:DUF3325 domain-containing protein n=1 Tax=Sphingomonas aracearum TaxID=2283317 RepID=A0A369VUU7_9SPHN|nr:DUF3325 domain-containing protein [Sphingomonas aracearum]RDE05629.1 DUF3325 domain-containing protein [Sphingomonas aracearum]
MIVLAFLPALLAFALLGLASHDHYLRWFGHRPTRRTQRPLRIAASVALALSLVLAVASRGWGFGPVLWSGLVMLAAGCVFLFLNVTEAHTPHGRRQRNAR